MKERPKSPSDLARRMKKASYYVQRASRQTSLTERQRLADAAEHYRELAELEEEVGQMRPKPPAPSI